MSNRYLSNLHGLRKTGLNSRKNLSVPLRISEHILEYDSINTTNPNDYTYTITRYPGKNYNNKSLAFVCQQFGDASRLPTSRTTVYKNPDITSIEDKLRKALPLAETSANDLMSNIMSNENEIKQIIDHYLQNIECTQVATDTEINPAEAQRRGLTEVPEFDLVPVNYPFTAEEATRLKSRLTHLNQDETEKLKIIVKKYKSLQTVIGGKTIDEWLTMAVDCQRFIGTNVREIIRLFDPEYNNFNIEMIINNDNLSLQSMKYGSVRETDLLSGAYLNTQRYPGVNDFIFQTSMEAPASGSGFITLFTIIGMLYHNPSTFIFAFAHELGHALGAGRIGSDSDGKLRFSVRSMNKLEQIFNKEKMLQAYRQNMIDKPGQKYGRSLYGEGSWEGMFSESMADVIGLCFVEKWVDTLPDLESKYKAIITSTLFSCGSNTMDEGHPPNSLRINTVFLNKKLHDVINGYISLRHVVPVAPAASAAPAPSSNIREAGIQQLIDMGIDRTRAEGLMNATDNNLNLAVNLAFSGGRRKFKKTKKNIHKKARKSTRRRRM